jgi:predicted transposase/invertase (TIGR01784 family)
MQDQWVYFIKNAGNLTEVPQELAKSNDFKQAFEIINEAGMSAEELEAQYKRREFIVMNKGALEQALAKGLAEGKVEGKAEGVAEATLAIARGMKAKGLDEQTIMDLTGLTADEIAKL